MPAEGKTRQFILVVADVLACVSVTKVQYSGGWRRLVWTSPEVPKSPKSTHHWLVHGESGVHGGEWSGTEMSAKLIDETYRSQLVQRSMH